VGEERLLATLTGTATSLSTDGRYVVWADRETTDGPARIELHDWQTRATRTVAAEALAEFALKARSGDVIWEHASAGNPTGLAELMLYDCAAGTSRLLTSHATRYRAALLDAGSVVWAEGSGAASTLVLYPGGDEPVRTIVATGSVKSPEDFAGDLVVWVDGALDAGEVCVHDLSDASTTRLTDNDIRERDVRTDGRILAWIEGDGGPGTARLHDWAHSTSRVLSGASTVPWAPSVDRGRVAWTAWATTGSHVFTASVPLFDDVSGRYEAAIQVLGERRLIDGYPKTRGALEFKPENPVFRAQFAKMIDGALDLIPSETMSAPVTFTDLGYDNPASLYPHEYVWTAYQHGIVYGYGDGSFRPYSSIQRGHVVSMAVRAMQSLHPGLLNVPPASFVQTWGLALLAEHRANAEVAEYNGLLVNLPPDDEATSAEGPMSRQEVAQVMYNMMRTMPWALPNPPD
jgi:hypothetical protein